MEMDSVEPGTVGSAETVPNKEFQWQVVARSIVVAFLAMLAVVAYLRQFIESPWALLGVCGGVLLYNSFLILTDWLRERPAHATLVCLILDIISLTSYLHFSGDIENPLMFAYSLPVGAGAVLVSRRAGFFLAAGAALAFFALMIFTTIDASPIVLTHHHLALLGNLDLTHRIDPDDNPQGWNYILTHLLVLTAVLLGTAHGFGSLSERLREKEYALRVENDRLMLLLSILPEGVVLLGKDGSILHANPAARMLVDGTASRTVGSLNPELGLAERFSLFSGSVEEFETSFRDRVYEHALARRVPGGPVVWVFRDTTDHRRLVGQVMHRSKMEDLGLLAAGIAHEIGNPLSSMSAIIQLMLMKGASPEIADRLKALASHVERIGRIVQDITGFARPSAGKRTGATARGLIDKALQIFRLHDKAKEIEVALETPNSPLRVEVVEDQIVQVLLNLLLNAADASGGRGQVGIQARSSQGQVEIAVVDHGSGITPEARSHLFTPFFTTKGQGKGVGLGLFMSESIARAHDGRIEVQSSPNKGSTFTLCLPLNGQKA